MRHPGCPPPRRRVPGGSHLDHPEEVLAFTAPWGFVRPIDSRARQTPWSVFQDGSGGVPTVSPLTHAIGPGPRAAHQTRAKPTREGIPVSAPTIRGGRGGAPVPGGSSVPRAGATRGGLTGRRRKRSTPAPTFPDGLMAAPKPVVALRPREVHPSPPPGTRPAGADPPQGRTRSPRRPAWAEDGLNPAGVTFAVPPVYL